MDPELLQTEIASAARWVELRRYAGYLAEDLAALKSLEIEGPRTFCLGNLVFFLLVDEYEKFIEHHLDFRAGMAVFYVPTMVEFVVVNGAMKTDTGRPKIGELCLFPTYRVEGEAGSPLALGRALCSVVRDRPDELFGILVNPYELIPLIGLIWEIEVPVVLEPVVDMSPEEVTELVAAEEEAETGERDEDGGLGSSRKHPRKQPQPPTTKAKPRKPKGRDKQT